MKKLWGIKLVTPMEEEVAMKNQVMELTSRNKDLKADLDKKRQSYTKFIEENQEQKDQRELEIQNLRKEINEENATKAQNLHITE